MAKTNPDLGRARSGQRPRPRRKQRRSSTRLRQIAVIAFLFFAVVVVARGLSFRGEVVPGVAVAGVDIGGLSEADAKVRLKTEFDQRLARSIDVTLDRQTAAMVPSELGAKVDITATVDMAMRTGRLRSLLLPFVYSADSELLLAIPLRPRIPATLRLVAQPPRSAAVSIVHGQAKVTRARDGRSISAQAILRAATIAAIDGRQSAALTSKAISPAVSTAEARQAASAALAMAAAPISLSVDGKRVGALSTAALAAAVIVREEGGKAQIAFDPKRLAPALGEALGTEIRDAQNAIWETNGTRAWVVPATSGRGFQPRAAADAVRDAAVAGGARQATIKMTVIEPGRTTKQAEQFNIVARVAGASTNLGDSSENRIHNVALMAEILDLRLVLAGETFSFNNAVGPRTPERGFREGLAISGGLMIPSIGGGVCQVATTLYDAAFAMGLSIGQRVNHSFYISHYGLGMDAAVSWGGPDLSFTNNTDHPLLIRATADASTMIVNLYSAPSDGRSIEAITGERYNVVPATNRYLSDPLAPAGKVVPYTDGQDGFSVDVTRIVKLNGEILSDDIFASTYVPEGKTFLVGPGAYPPGDNLAEAPPYGWKSPFAT